MNIELLCVFGNTLNCLPQDCAQDAVLTFDNNNLPKLEQEVYSTDQISISKGWHYYNDCYRIEKLDVCTNKKHYNVLGLLLLKSLFENRTFVLNLTNSNSFIKQLKIVPYSDKKQEGLVEQSIQYNYWAKKIDTRYPFGALEDCPSFHLLAKDNNVVWTDESWSQRAILEISGSASALSNLATLFLDIANPSNTRDEIGLESKVGFGGVSPSSVEITFWLPNSFGWDFEAGIVE